MFYDLGMSPDQLDFFRLLHNVEAPFAALFAARGTSRSTPTARLGAAQRTRMSTAAVLRRGDLEADGPAGLQVWEFAYDKYPIHVQAPPLRR